MISSTATHDYFVSMRKALFETHFHFAASNIKILCSCAPEGRIMWHSAIQWGRADTVWDCGWVGVCIKRVVRLIYESCNFTQKNSLIQAIKKVMEKILMFRPDITIENYVYYAVDWQFVSYWGLLGVVSSLLILEWGIKLERKEILQCRRLVIDGGFIFSYYFQIDFTN